MLHSRVFARRISRSLALPFLSQVPIPRPSLPRFHGIIAFADPHLLTTIESYRYKKMGGGPSRSRSLFCLSPILRTLFQVPYPVSPAFATLTKTPGVWGYSFHFGARRLPVITHHFALLCFHAFTNCRFHNSFLLIFIQIGGGYPLPTFNVPTVFHPTTSAILEGQK